MILEEDWVLVTRNSDDFRGPMNIPGSRGQYANVFLHAGLICLNGPVGMDLAIQRRLFAEALEELNIDDNLINQVLEINLNDDENAIDVIRYALPSD